jgi:hypothetical protein
LAGFWPDFGWILAEIYLAVHWQLGILIFPVFGRFSAKLGFKTPSRTTGLVLQ